MVRKPTVISLFSGCGGSSLGYRWAGYRELLAIDLDERAVEAFKLNFPDVPCWQRDIKGVTGREILEFCGIKKGELDLLDASPPCQGFSMAGDRKVGDPRNGLFSEFVRLLRGLEPKVFIMENVPGMVRGTMRGMFNEILSDLEASSYKVRSKLMNSKWYGVPQSRQRVILVGTRSDLETEPTFPIRGRKIVTVKQAIGDLPLGRPGKHSPEIMEAWRACRPNESLRRVDIRSGNPRHRYVGSFHSCRLSLDRPSPTLTKTHTHWHYAVPRKLNEIELKRICSFPDEFKFLPKTKVAGELMGNAVMPKFMEAIARTIKEEVLDHVPRP